MKPWELNKRVDCLSEKLKPVSSEGIRIDFDSFPEPEKQLFRKIWEIQEKYGSSPPADVIEANKEFIFKAWEVIGWRVLELFMFVMQELLGGEYQQPIPFVPTEEQVDALIAGVGKRTAPFLQLLKETGVRLGEAVRLKWTDIDFARGTVSINTPEKKSLPRILKISPTLIAMLNVLPRTTAYVFIRDKKSVETNLKKNFSIAKNAAEKNFRDQRHKLARKLGNERLKQIHLHTFRHFYATMLYAKTLNILKVQQALGHKNLMNTQIYTHLINFPSDEYDVQVAETLDEAKKLLEAGFDYVTDMDGRKIFRRRK